MFLGVFPPPIHGAAIINERLMQALVSRGGDVVKLNLISRNFTNRQPRLIFLSGKLLATTKALLFFLYLATQRKRKTLYISTAGGLGKLFELPFIIVARASGSRIWIHHHSFNYLDQPHPFEKFFFLLAGSKSTHVVLCDQMEKRLTTFYHINPHRIHTLSNSAFISNKGIPEPTPKIDINTIGFLSNISFEKGIREFIDSCRSLERHHIRYKALIAGPFASVKVRDYVHDACKQLHSLSYIGPVYGETKTTFLDNIDIFLFPSHNEAEPLVIYEANARGVYVLSVGVGCIASMLKNGGGEASKNSTKLTPSLIKTIAYLRKNRHIIPIQSSNAILTMKKKHTSAKESLNLLTIKVLSN